MVHMNGRTIRWSRTRRIHHRRAFTMIELLVVIGVILVLAVTTLPAFRALGEGTRTAGGVNGVSAALNTARSLASRHGRDVALLFKFDIERRVISMQYLVQDGVTYRAGGGINAASIFIPIEGAPELELPSGVGVYGYGYGASDADPDDESHWYADLRQASIYQDPPPDSPLTDPWLFPRSDPYFFAEEGQDPDDDDYKMIDSFIVRFSPDGTVVTNAEELGASALGGDCYLELDLPGSESYNNNPDEYRKWDPRLQRIGGEDLAVTEVQMRAVPFLAIVDLRLMGDELGIRRPELAGGEEMPRVGDRWDANGNGEPDHIEIDKWIHLNAPLIAFNRYTGELMTDVRR